MWTIKRILAGSDELKKVVSIILAGHPPGKSIKECEDDAKVQKS